MILEQDDADGFAGRVTLDQIFRRLAERRPEALALIDRRSSDTPRLRMSFADADRAIAALAGRLAELALPLDSVVGIQGPAGIGGIVAILATQRAGLIPMLLPELWRDLDVLPALRDSGARALIALDPALQDLHGRVAAEVFAVRFVCALSDTAADGITPLGSLPRLMTAELGAPSAPRTGNPAAHVALLTWDANPDGHFLVPRSHRALVAGGVPVLIEGRIDETAVIVDTLSLTTFAGLAGAVLPWLMTGSTLVFEVPFDLETLPETVSEHAATHLVLPTEIAPSVVSLAALDTLRGLLLVDRAPEGVPAPLPIGSEIQIVDVAAFGEAAVIARRRQDTPSRITIPARGAPGAADDPIAGVVRGHRTPHGTLALSGSAVPSVAFPAAAGNGLPLIADGAYDTGWTCHPEAGGTVLACDAPPRGVARIGGYRFGVRDVEAKLAARLGAAVEVATIPHRLLGQRVVVSCDLPRDGEAMDDVAPVIGVTLAGGQRIAS